MSDYDAGYAAGQRDSAIVSLPPNTGEHTFERWQAIKARLEDCYIVDPTNWQRGFADGFDAEAVIRNLVRRLSCRTQRRREWVAS